MIKLKNFIKDSILTSFNVEVKAPKQVLSVSKPSTPSVKKTKQKRSNVGASSVSTSKKPKGYFSTGQIIKQAKKQGYQINYKLAKKLSYVKQTKQQLYNKIYYQKQKYRAEQRQAVLKSQGRNVNAFINRYRRMLQAEYERNPTLANLKKLQDASTLSKEAKLLDEAYKSHWKDIKQEILKTKERTAKSRHAGNVSKPHEVGNVGTSAEDYIMSNYYDRVEAILSEDEEKTEQEAIYEVMEELVADGTLQPLQQYYDTGVLWGYWDEDTGEVISPI